MNAYQSFCSQTNAANFWSFKLSFNIIHNANDWGSARFVGADMTWRDIIGGDARYFELMNPNTFRDCGKPFDFLFFFFYFFIMVAKL